MNPCLMNTFHVQEPVEIYLLFKSLLDTYFLATLRGLRLTRIIYFHYIPSSLLLRAAPTSAETTSRQYIMQIAKHTHIDLDKNNFSV